MARGEAPRARPIQARAGAAFPTASMRSASLACAVALLTAGCLGRGRHGAIDESRFVAPDDQQLHLLLGDYPNPGPNASSDIHDTRGNVVPFPAARARFADEVVSYDVGAPAPVPEGQDPRTALGPPDYTPDKWVLPRAVSLGNGGVLTLKWNQGVLSDGEGPDIFIFEIGPSVEAVNVDISADGEHWIAVGTAPGGSCAIDIGPYVQTGDVFHYVRLRDIPWKGTESDAWPGADIDAVAVVAGAQRVSVPSEVLFALDSDTLAPSAAGELDRVIAAIRARPGARVTVEGHTDDQGDDAYNQALSERRARAVADHLIEKGIARDRIRARGLGETRPVAPNDVPEGRKKNRRVEIVIDDR
ncbi:Flagellar motor rotation protein MotB [Minicystis rosea]|nr:Flagellar motor rotation protein MotB [Minicystis rosea]